MKKIIFWVLLLVPVHTFSQLRDDFSDGKFTTNWTGDVGKFIVNDNFQLQLNAPKETGSAQLRTKSTLSTNTSWEFWMKLGFNPTSSNYAKIYLCSESEDLAESPKSLYIRMGYTNKNICLISREGSSEKVLITGAKDRLNLATPALDIKAKLNRAGQFELYSRLEGESEYVLEGNCNMATTFNSSYFGIICQYTSTRNTHFLFDNFVVRELTDEENGNIRPPYYDEPRYRDVVFNEIMANPTAGQPEYVELYNRTNKIFQLKDWKFYYGDKPYAIPEIELKPYGYIILTKNTTTATFQDDIKVAGITSFPTLAKSGKLLYLENKDGSLISWFEYSDKMYGNNEKKNGGWSLECIDPENFTNGISNWTASIAAEGNTAGKLNSVKANNPDNESPVVKSIEIKNDTVVIAFTKPMDESTLLSKSGYLISNSDYKILELKSNYPQANQVMIRFNSVPPQGTMIQMILEGLRDVSGFPLEWDKYIALGSGNEADPLDVIINEVLFNAPTESEEYIEFYNRSKKLIDLRYLSITTRKTDGTLNKSYPLTSNPIMLNPENYVVITKNKNAVCSYYHCKGTGLMIELSNTPILNNTSGCIVLLNNKKNTIIDEFSYNEKMHAEAIKDKKGVALERLNFNRETNDPGNWHSASSDSGYGTPGYVNSQQKNENFTGTQDEVKINYPNISFGAEAYEIQYHFSNPGNRCRAFLYDTTGKVVNTIANNEMLGTEGKLYWYGNYASGQRLHSGVYIVYMEVFSAEGKVKKFKLPVVMK